MASPQQPYTDEGPDPEGGQYQQNGAYQDQSAAAAAPAGKKKRAYAGQAYEFGAGGNAALGGQPPAGGQYPGSPQVAAGGYGFQGQQAMPQQPAYGMPQQPQYGDPNVQSPQAPAAPGQQPQYAAPQGGYEPPAAGYPTQPQQVQQAGVQGVQQQFSQMSIGGNQPAPQAPGQQVRLNPLQPVDISMQGQPFHVTDLDQPPPAIILPANVSLL